MSEELKAEIERLEDETQLPDVLESIPPPEIVRRKLGEVLRQTRLLRQLLRISEAIEKERQKE